MAAGKAPGLTSAEIQAMIDLTTGLDGLQSWIDYMRDAILRVRKA